MENYFPEISKSISFDKLKESMIKGMQKIQNDISSK